MASWSERQIVPGLTQRTIWGRDQVYVYRLPKTVTHTGDLHVELRYAPADGDCFICLLGPVAKWSIEWQVCQGTYGQGFLSLWPGREVIDYEVPAVLNDDLVDEGVRGDAYYVVVQAANAASRFRLTGYLARATAGSTDTTSEQSFTRQEFATPARASATITISGAPCGAPFDLTPPSQESGRVPPRIPRRRSTANGDAGVRRTAGELRAVRLPALLGPEADAIPVSQPTDYSHWDIHDLNRHAATPLVGADWYGLQGAFTTQAAGPWKPRSTYHYVPVLWLASWLPHAVAPGAPAAPATGLRTVGYKATLLIPQNQRLASATKRVLRGARATLRGTLALPSASAPDAAAWAPPGTRVWIRRKAGARWVSVTSVTSGASGAWRAVVGVRATTRWRAWWPGGGGFALEFSPVKKTTVRGR